MIELVGLNFIKDYYAINKHYDYPKIEYISKILRFGGTGLLFT